MSETTHSSGAAALRGGAREALGVPAAVLGAGFIGYGSLAAEHGYSVAQAVAATVLIWALPAQLVLIELPALGASLLAVIAAVMFSSARFLPMTISLMPLLRDSRYGAVTRYACAQVISMTTWAVSMQRCPLLPVEQRLPYLAGFGIACLAVSAACTAAGHGLAGVFPPLARLGFVFLTPLYFFVILVGEVRTRLAALALSCGAISGPLFHLLSPEWSVVLAGFAGGSIAYWLQKAYGRRA